MDCEFLQALPNVFHAATGNKQKLNPSRRFVSVEIEIARLRKREFSGRIHAACREWGAGIVSDGSLPDSGFEINTAPAAGDKFVEEITAICKALTRCSAEVTNQCGLHVHIDARDFTYYEVKRLIRTYSLIEDALFSIVSPSRRDNRYCIRCGTDYLQSILSGTGPQKLKDTIAKAVYKDSYRNGNLEEKRQSKYDHARYAALNLHSWYYRGTVECRLFNSTASAEKIINWGILWAGILDWVYVHTEEDVDALYRIGSSWKALMAVAPTDRVRNWLDRRRSEFIRD